MNTSNWKHFPSKTISFLLQKDISQMGSLQKGYSWRSEHITKLLWCLMRNKHLLQGLDGYKHLDFVHIHRKLRAKKVDFISFITTRVEKDNNSHFLLRSAFWYAGEKKSLNVKQWIEVLEELSYIDKKKNYSYLFWRAGRFSCNKDCWIQPCLNKSGTRN